MKIGLFTATFLDMKLEEVFKMASDLGYQAVEMPAFANNPHLDIEEIVKGSKAADLKKLVKDNGLVISPWRITRKGRSSWDHTARTRTGFAPEQKKKK